MYDTRNRSSSHYRHKKLRRYASIMEFIDERTLTQIKKKSNDSWGTGCILINNKGELLVGKRTDTKNWCTPGGKVDYDETVVEGMMREVKEEANLTVKDYKCYEAHVGSFKGDKMWISFMFICKDFEGKVTPQLTEISGWVWLTIDEIKKLELFPPTKAALEIAGKQGLINW